MAESARVCACVRGAGGQAWPAARAARAEGHGYFQGEDGDEDINNIIDFLSSG